MDYKDKRITTKSGKMIFVRLKQFKFNGKDKFEKKTLYKNISMASSVCLLFAGVFE
jgi:hypothetical protein